jgi:hypothetical protein
MGSPPPPPESSSNDQDVVEAGVDFDLNPPTASSLCGFKFPPTFSFSFSFHIPGFPACITNPLSCIPIPWLSLSCDLSNPISGGWGGERTDTSDKPDDEDKPWVE